jgi:hypothetical protein
MPWLLRYVKRSLREDNVLNVPSRIAAPVAGLALLLAVSAAARAQVGPGSVAASDAYAISAAFTSQSMTTTLGPVDEAAGSAPPAYNVTKSLASFDQTIAIPPLIPAGGPLPPVAASFTATATGLKSNAASNGIELDYVLATGKSAVATASLTITNTIPPGSALPVLLYLGVTASKVATTAVYSQTVPLPPAVSGTASFGALTISGELLDGHTVTYSGAAPPNTVLYKSPVSSVNEVPAVTITADAQIAVGTIGCGATCVFNTTRIDVAALSISLANAMINGFPVTGTILLGSASAQ